MDEFNRMLELEIPRLRRYARALTHDPCRADDLVQECLCRALRKADLWAPGTDLRAWLFTILHHLNVNYIRRSVREGQTVPAEDVEPILTVRPSQSAAVELRELDRAIGQLPAEQRQILLLTALEGLSYEQVAVVLGIAVGTVRSRLSRGREALRRLMDGDRGRVRTAAPAHKRMRGRRGELHTAA